ncbi:hypothetical protein PHYBOEH_006737 [Phytophthora boehmeriae]|uniref:EF-hand domain-containing protein n=1 Tax=Phytophthora boehmeriae TaxID=109152 RepID=A0A8T1X784_9STRA|nr:hypothetical protein PHYBOEH_006737 [Phytophthora boehmeriae]
MNVKAFAHALSVLDKRLRPKQIHDLTHFVATYCSEAVSCGEFISLVALYRTLVGTPDESIAAEPVSDSNTVDSYASKTIERIRARLFADSSDCESIGIVHPDNLHSLKPIFHKFLQKKSPWLSGSNDGSVLSKGELRACLQHIGVDVTYQELDYLFAYFDIDRDGFIDFDLFIDVLGDVSNPLPKLIQRPPSRRLSTKAEPKAADAAVQELPTLGRTSSLQTVGRKKQQATTRVQQPNYRRSNVIQRAIWDFSTRPRTGSLTEGLAGRDRSHEIDAERRYRYRAAQLIQSMFRGFRSRQIAMQLRRKVFAQRQRRIEESEPLNVKKRISRTVLGNAYGF